jgi:hypothetical protein
MQRNQVLGMICGYYLSRFDEDAYSSLGYGTQEATHNALGEALGVAPKSIKNWRDEFDPVHDNPRRGWSGREMYPSRRRTIEALGDLSQSELLALLRTFLADSLGSVANEVVIAIGDVDGDGTSSRGTYGLRGPTGARAERAFAQHHEQYALPMQGTLVDRRYEQCGYDYEIIGENGSVFVEVKGLCGNKGGVTFTDKEWSTAKQCGDRYFLAIVRHAGSDPEISLVQDPFTRLQATMRTFTTVQTGWSVGDASLRTAEMPTG